MSRAADPRRRAPSAGLNRVRFQGTLSTRGPPPRIPLADPSRWGAADPGVNGPDRRPPARDPSVGAPAIGGDRRSAGSRRIRVTPYRVFGYAIIGAFRSRSR